MKVSRDVGGGGALKTRQVVDRAVEHFNRAHVVVLLGDVAPGSGADGGPGGRSRGGGGSWGR